MTFTARLFYVFRASTIEPSRLAVDELHVRGDALLSARIPDSDWPNTFLARAAINNVHRTRDERGSGGLPTHQERCPPRQVKYHVELVVSLSRFARRWGRGEAYDYGHIDLLATM